MSKSTITYNHIATLKNEARIYEPLFNIDHKYCIDATINDRILGILIQCEKINEKWAGKILSVYDQGKNLFSPRYTHKYLWYVDECVDLMENSGILK